MRAPRYPALKASPAPEVSTTRSAGANGPQISGPPTHSCGPAAPSFSAISSTPCPASRANSSCGVSSGQSLASSSREGSASVVACHICAATSRAAATSGHRAGRKLESNAISAPRRRIAVSVPISVVRTAAGKIANEISDKNTASAAPRALSSGSPSENNRRAAASERQ